MMVWNESSSNKYYMRFATLVLGKERMPPDRIGFLFSAVAPAWNAKCAFSVTGEVFYWTFKVMFGLLEVGGGSQTDTFNKHRCSYKIGVSVLI